MAEPVVNGNRTYGQYEVESVLGSGAMGMVYLARDRRIGRRVALKTVQLSQKFEDESEANEFYKRLQREAEVVGSMQHPNIVTLYEPGYENDVISYLATEYVEGESLKERLKRTKPLPLDEALLLAEDILCGLAYAHAKGIIHRDIKPANILVTSDGHAKIADFGIARRVDSNLTVVGSMLGTPNYMSPEQVKCAAVTTKSDLFAVGVVLYEMLTGIKPFAGPDVSGILRNVIERDPQLASEVNQQVPDPVARFIAHLFAKDPESRFESAAIALAELQRMRSSLTLKPVEDITPSDSNPNITPSGSYPTISTNPRVASLSMARPRSIRPSAFWGIVLALVAPLAVWGVMIRQRSDPRPSGVITAAQRAEFGAKKQALENARALTAAGRYDESIRAYDTYMLRYPASVAAQEGRADAARRLEAARSKSTVTARASKRPPAKKAPSVKAEEPQKKPSMWRRIFRRGDKKPSTPPPATPPR